MSHGRVGPTGRGEELQSEWHWSSVPIVKLKSPHDAMMARRLAWRIFRFYSTAFACKDEDVHVIYLSPDLLAPYFFLKFKSSITEQLR